MKSIRITRRRAARGCADARRLRARKRGRPAIPGAAAAHHRAFPARRADRITSRGSSRRSSTETLRAAGRRRQPPGRRREHRHRHRRQGAADGYTILLSSSAFTVNPTLYAKIPYDPFRDFQPLTCAGNSPNMVAVHPNLAAKTLPQLVELVKSQPGKHSYSSPGAGTTPHLSGEMFRMAFNLDLRHVPYGGAGPQVLSMIGGQVPIGFASVPSFAQQVKAGQLRGLAVTAEKRMSALPDIPSTGELGMKGLTGDTFQGVFARAGTPPAHPRRGCTPRSRKRWRCPTCAKSWRASVSSRAATRPSNSRRR